MWGAKKRWEVGSGKAGACSEILDRKQKASLCRDHMAASQYSWQQSHSKVPLRGASEKVTLLLENEDCSLLSPKPGSFTTGLFLDDTGDQSWIKKQDSQTGTWALTYKSRKYITAINSNCKLVTFLLSRQCPQVGEKVTLLNIFCDGAWKLRSQKTLWNDNTEYLRSLQKQVIHLPFEPCNIIA